MSCFRRTWRLEGHMSMSLRGTTHVRQRPLMPLVAEGLIP